MSASDDTKGSLRAALNPHKQAGDKRPAFEGTVTVPDNPVPRRLVLWALKTRKGASMLAGRAGETAREQIANLATPPKAPADTPLTDGKQFAIDPYEVMLFETASADPAHSDRPDYWGYYHPGADAKLMRLAVWAKTDRDGKAVLSGTVKPHQQDKTHEHQPAAKARRRERER